MTATHRRSIHIDAPVEKVFDYVRNPHNTFAVVCETPTSRIDRHVKSELTDVTITSDGGVGTTWSFKASLFLYSFEATYTRQEYVHDERIVDGNLAAGLSMTFDFEPDASGTPLTMAWGISSKVTLLSTVWDRIYWDGDRDLDSMLSSVKNAVES